MDYGLQWSISTEEMQAGHGHALYLQRFAHLSSTIFNTWSWANAICFSSGWHKTTLIHFTRLYCIRVILKLYVTTPNLHALSSHFHTITIGKLWHKATIKLNTKHNHVICYVVSCSKSKMLRNYLFQADICNTSGFCFFKNIRLFFIRHSTDFLPVKLIPTALPSA